MSGMPPVDELISAVRDALDDVTKSDSVTRPSGERTFEILDGIRRRIDRPGIEFAFRGPNRYGEESEWLFDFCALFFEENARDARRFVAQALIVGEIELSKRNGLDEDFEKLLIADSIVCFFVFPARRGNAATDKLTELEHLARRRQGYAKRRGMLEPPVFVISCYYWYETPSCFDHRIVRADLP